MSIKLVLSLELVDTAATSERPDSRPLCPEAAEILYAAAERMRVAVREDEARLPSGRGPLSFLGFHPRAT